MKSMDRKNAFLCQPYITLRNKYYFFVLKLFLWVKIKIMQSFISVWIIITNQIQHRNKFANFASCTHLTRVKSDNVTTVTFTLKSTARSRRIYVFLCNDDIKRKGCGLCARKERGSFRHFPTREMFGKWRPFP